MTDDARAVLVKEAFEAAANRLCIVYPGEAELIAALRTLSLCDHVPMLAHLGRMLKQ